ncbi:hypothetical protein [Dyadobacter psychrotolerans]|uniref:Uncharacterized protein n=1 Tax=Dyadobacter psychrotolerans TaxID=2541721 RepID=A0A4R5DNZ3_9BACT|nr:hypothetical protein [Dyadobacter psychrotolerans]TDE15287.1 hypothetical protein E0F88_12245 [Dyadobacter psychrotolerans]
MSYVVLNNITGLGYGSSFYLTANNVRSASDDGRGPVYSTVAVPDSQLPDPTPVPTETKLVLASGQILPPVGKILYSTTNLLRFWEDKEQATLFGVDGKTKEQCSTPVNQVVGSYTGNYFAKKSPFGRIDLFSVEVKATFPFNRQGKAVQTTIPLWVNVFVRYNEEGIIDNPTGPGSSEIPYQMDENGNIVQGSTVESNSKIKYWIGGILLFLFIKSRK